MCLAVENTQQKKWTQKQIKYREKGKMERWKMFIFPWRNAWESVNLLLSNPSWRNENRQPKQI